MTTTENLHRCEATEQLLNQILNGTKFWLKKGVRSAWNAIMQECGNQRGGRGGVGRGGGPLRRESKENKRLLVDRDSPKRLISSVSLVWEMKLFQIVPLFSSRIGCFIAILLSISDVKRGSLLEPILLLLYWPKDDAASVSPIQKRFWIIVIWLKTFLELQIIEAFVAARKKIRLSLIVNDRASVDQQLARPSHFLWDQELIDWKSRDETF